MATEWIVGRSKDCDIRLHDESVSRRHMIVRDEGGGRFTVTDTESLGGIYIDTGGGWQRIKTETVDAATPLKLGEFTTTLGDILSPGKNTRVVKTAFISHASADRDTANKVIDYLESRGFSCWVAPRDVRPGYDYGEEIIRGIENAHSFVLIHSSAANESHFVKREVERAVSKNKIVLPLRVEDVPLSAGLELFVSSAHWIDAWGGPIEDHLDRLATSLARGGMQPLAPVPTPESSTETSSASDDSAAKPRIAQWRSWAAAVAVLAVLAAGVVFLDPGGWLGGGGAADTRPRLATFEHGNLEIVLSSADTLAEKQVILDLFVHNAGADPAQFIVDDNHSIIELGNGEKLIVQAENVTSCRKSFRPRRYLEQNWRTDACIDRIVKDGIQWTRVDPGKVHDFKLVTVSKGEVLDAGSATGGMRLVVRSQGGSDSEDFEFPEITLGP